MSVNKKEKKYDFSLKTVDERSKLIEDKLNFIFDIKPYMIMGYSSEDMDGEKKNDRIPKMIDGYTTYYLKSKDAGSSRKTEYSYYTCKRDEMRRKGNKILYGESEPFDGYGSEIDSFYSPSDIVADNSVNMKNIDFSYENINTATIKYAIKNGKLNKNNVKKLLSHTGDILTENEDKELSDIIEQLVFNCYINANDEVDSKILELYIRGLPLREISEKTGVGKSTVDRRINNLMSWVGQN